MDRNGDWQAALTVSAVFASNGYDRFHFGLNGGGLAIGAAATLGLVGLAGFAGAPVQGTHLLSLRSFF